MPHNVLKDVEKQELTAKKFGFYWTSIHQLIEQIQSECQEVQEAYAKGDQINLQEEIGDLLQAAVCLAVYCNFNPEETLKNSIDKFQKRYDKVVELAKNEGHADFHDKSVEFMLAYWDRAKEMTMDS